MMKLCKENCSIQSKRNKYPLPAFDQKVCHENEYPKRTMENKVDTLIKALKILGKEIEIRLYVVKFCQNTLKPMDVVEDDR